MSYVRKHQNLHGASTHATRGLDFLEAVAPRLGTMAEMLDRGAILAERDVRLLSTCASAIPSYVEDLSRCHGLMARARAALMLIVDRQGGACEHYTGDMPQQCYAEGRKDDAEYGADQTCDACVAHRALYGEDQADWPPCEEGES